MPPLTTHRRFIEEGLEQSLVIALERNKTTGKWITQQALDHTTGFGTAINIVSERYGQIVFAMLINIATNSFNQSIEQIQAAVNVANNVKPSWLA